MADAFAYYAKSQMKAEVINGATPLERHPARTHPRLYLTAERIEDLRKKTKREPYASLLKKVLVMADGAVKRPCTGKGGEKPLDRGHGCSMPHLALAFLLTRNENYLKSVRQYIRAAATYDTWGPSLLFGHVSFGMSLAYDWLYHDLDEETKQVARSCLTARAKEIAYALGTHQGWLAGVYTCNHLPVTMAGLVAAAAALYGDAGEMAPVLRLSMEKFRLMTDALGPDGVSQEGIGYGEYYSEFLLKGLVLVRDLLNLDLFGSCEWLKNTPLFYLYSSLPRNSWTAGSCLMSFGDGVPHHWYGPDTQLHYLAAEYRDPVAQWLADEKDAAGVCSNSASYLNLLWYDPTVKDRPPSDLPTMRHFTDKDIVLLRSGWDGEESVFAFKCGPHSGHHALANYPHDIGGGHMHPDAGAFQIFAYGDWLLGDGGYCFKMTKHHNTILVNGIGQTGEGHEWLESTELRMEKRAPSILRVESHDGYDYVTGNVAPAYEKAAGLKRFLRHVLYIKPSCWIIIDELEAEQPSIFELYFHTHFPVAPAGERRYTATGTNGALLMEALLPGDVTGRTEKQTIINTAGKAGREMDLLVLSNTETRAKALFTTMLHAYPTSGEVSVSAAIEEYNGKTLLRVVTTKKTFSFVLDVDRDEALEKPILAPTKSPEST